MITVQLCTPKNSLTEKDKERVEFLVENLPHGSGFDDVWQIYVTRQYINCQMSYHRMNEGGYYDGWINFTVKIPRQAKSNDKYDHPRFNFKITYPDNWSRRIASYEMFDSYFGDTLAYALENYPG